MRDAMETTPKIRYHPPRPEQEPEYDTRSLLGLHGVPVLPLQRGIFRIGLIALAMAAFIVVVVVLATT